MAFSRKYLLRIALLAAAYAACGRLALVLAIPPGYATAVWPPSGIAVAALLLGGYTLWPGVFIGSLIKDILSLYDATSPAALLDSLSLSASISFGATVEALVGAWLINRFIGYRNIFTQEVDVVRMVILAGPVACTLNAFISITLLWRAGHIPDPNYLFSLWTWYVGDTIGVVIFMPLVLAWALKPTRQWLRKQIALTIPLGFLFAVVVALFFNVSASEQSRLKTEFENRARAFSGALQSSVNEHLLILDSLKSFYAASEFVSREEFSLFAANLLHEHRQVVAVEWLPKVIDSDRSRFEQSVRAEGFPEFEIRDRIGNGVIGRAPRREQYFPVLYAEPLQANRAAIGFDAASTNTRRDAVSLAVDFGEPRATGRMQLVQDKQPRWSILLMNAIYRGALDYPTPEARRAHLMGIGQVVLRIDNVIPPTLPALLRAGLSMRIVDVSPGVDRELLYGPEEPDTKAAMNTRFPVFLADRKWMVEFTLGEHYLVEHRSREAWGWLAAGLGITALLGILILVLIGRQSKVEELVTTQTAELRRVEEDLRRSNKELEQFAYVASHDLRAPLRSVLGFSELLERSLADNVSSDGKEYLRYIKDGAQHMNTLITDLLALARVGREGAERKAINSEEILAQVVQQLSSTLGECNAEVTHGPLPTVMAAPLELNQLLQNLIGNAVKFQKPGDRPRVHVSATRDGAFWRFSVRDNGIGIPTEHQQRIFEIFQRLHASESYEGTGIGLAICHKIVQRHGGRIWVESVPGDGASFFFTLPAPPANS